MKPRLWIAIFLAAGNLWAQPLRLEVGKAFFRHSQVERPNLISGMAWQEKGLTCMEFSLPLDYAPGKSMRSKDPTPIILAYHKDRGDLSKHSRRSSGTIALAK